MREAMREAFRVSPSFLGRPAPPSTPAAHGTANTANAPPAAGAPSRWQRGRILGAFLGLRRSRPAGELVEVSLPLTRRICSQLVQVAEARRELKRSPGLRSVSLFHLGAQFEQGGLQRTQPIDRSRPTAPAAVRTAAFSYETAVRTAPRLGTFPGPQRGWLRRKASLVAQASQASAACVPAAPDLSGRGRGGASTVGGVGQGGGLRP
mmetsp:Transcript_40683/g.91467  ORF Transcript_40683/g.91467 Transcript_40683/m.91467 type:complete len:207 (+) Transcript_40683:660-1280(+)